MAKIQRTMKFHTPTEVDKVAAAKLGVPLDVVLAISEDLYDHTLGAERDERVAERIPEGASPATLGSLRGHVTRQLLEESQAPLDKRIQDASGDMARVLAQAMKALEPLRTWTTEELGFDRPASYTKEAAEW